MYLAAQRPENVHFITADEIACDVKSKHSATRLENYSLIHLIKGKIVKYINLGKKAALTLAFVAAGATKLTRANDGWHLRGCRPQTMVSVCHWRHRSCCRHVALGANTATDWADLLTITMFGAVLAHILAFGHSAIPAVILIQLSPYTADIYKDPLVHKTASR